MHKFPPTTRFTTHAMAWTAVALMLWMPAFGTSQCKCESTPAVASWLVTTCCESVARQCNCSGSSECCCGDQCQCASEAPASQQPTPLPNSDTENHTQISLVAFSFPMSMYPQASELRDYPSYLNFVWARSAQETCVLLSRFTC